MKEILIKDPRIMPSANRGFVNHPYFDYETPMGRMPQIGRTPIDNAYGLPQIDGMPAPEFGMTYSDLLNKDLMQKFLISVIEMNYSVGHLSVPPLVREIVWPHRKGTLVLTPLFEVHSNVGEGEVVPLRTVRFDRVEVSMQKTVMKMGITDEMKMDAGDAFITPQDYMRSRMGEAFAHELDTQIMKQLENNPMKLSVDLSDEDKKRENVPKLIEQVIPQIIGAFMHSHLRVTGVAVNPSTWAFFQGVLNHNYNGMAMFREGVFPFLQGVDVCPCSLVPYNKMYFVSNDAPGIMVITHPQAIAHGFDDVDSGSEVQRVDVFRQCVSNIITRPVTVTKGQVKETVHNNAGVLELTLKGAPDPDTLVDIV